jgi:ATP-dependent Clp protease ATP-binding subunit ClpC
MLYGALARLERMRLVEALPLVAAAPARGNRFDRFTRRSKTVLRLAEQEAARLQHPGIGAEHLLLGILLEGEGVAAHMLAAGGIQAEELRSALLDHMGTGSGFDPRYHGLDPQAKRVIELSVREARRLRHHYLGTEHLLLGLVAAGDTLAANLLRERNVADLATLRTEMLRILTDGGPRFRPLT